MAISKLEAIQSLHPTAQFVLKGGELTWQSEDITEPTDAEITAEQTRLQAEYDNKQYQRDRAIAYPALAEQFDKLWHDINNGTLDNTGAFYTALKTVKDDNPKPGE
jgi:hypothetical protein